MLEKQVTSIVQRQSILHNMMDKVQAILNNGSIGHKIHHKDCEKDENLPYAIDQQKYQIAKDERNYIFLPNWLCEHRDDLAFKVASCFPYLTLLPHKLTRMFLGLCQKA